jgi:hypothetical protein
MFMYPRYGWPLDRRYGICAGFFNLPCRMAVTISFGQHCEKEPSQFISPRIAMEKMSGDQHSSNNHLKSDFLPIKPLIYIV